MQKVKDFLQIVDLLCKWVFNMVKYYYVTAAVVVFFRLVALGCGAELDHRWGIFFWTLIGIRVCHVLRKPLMRLLISTSYRKI